MYLMFYSYTNKNKIHLSNKNININKKTTLYINTFDIIFLYNKLLLLIKSRIFPI